MFDISRAPQPIIRNRKARTRYRTSSSGNKRPAANLLGHRSGHGPNRRNHRQHEMVLLLIYHLQPPLGYSLTDFWPPRVAPANMSINHGHGQPGPRQATDQFSSVSFLVFERAGAEKRFDRPKRRERARNFKLTPREPGTGGFYPTFLHHPSV